MKVATKSISMIQAFNPDPGDVRPTPTNLQELSDSEVAAALANGHPKSVPVKIHKGMEGERTGLPHLTPHSTRFRQAHEKFGTKVTPPGIMK